MAWLHPEEREEPPLCFSASLSSLLFPPGPPSTSLPPPQLLSNIFGEGIEGCLVDPKNSLHPSCYNTSYTLLEFEGGWLIGPASDPGLVWLMRLLIGCLGSCIIFKIRGIP